jgi:formylglycine-generating enzyme required for sulfatase activity
MGSHLTEPGRKMNEGPHTRVTITQPFLIAEAPISQAQWEAVMETTVADQRDRANPAWPLRGEGPDHPMYHVTWEEAIVFCNKLSRRFDMDISLPTEAQWERACRAGTDTPFFFGEDPLQLHLYAWRGTTYDRETHPLKRKKPNEWGLHDTLGNVWEWCLDQFGQYPGGARADWFNSADTAPSGEVPLRALRGGAWNRPPLDLRSASRSGFPQNKRASEVGFRIAASI